MPRGRVVLLGIVIAIISIGLTAVAFIFVVPGLFPGAGSRSGEGSQDDRAGGGESRDVAFDPDDRLQVVVALQSLPRGFTIPSDAYNNAVGVREWPAASVPLDAIVIEEGQDPQQVIRDQVEGKIARTDITREEPLLRANLVDNLSDLSQVGSDVAAQLAPNMRAFAIPVDKLTSVGYAVQAGDRVDVILSFEVVDVDEEFQTTLPNWVYELTGGFDDGSGRTMAGVNPQEGAAFGRIDTLPGGYLANVVPSELQRPRLVTQRALACAPVMLAGEAPADGRIVGVEDTSATPTAEDGGNRDGDGSVVPGPRPDVVILAITPQEVNVLQWAIGARVGISLSICSLQEGTASATAAVTLQYIFETYNVPVPPRLPYSLEPSLRDAPVPTVVLPAP
jgi:Flp pilus assembly protein CpaB